ncbi:MAG: Sulfite oxidase and related enzymes [uncultured Chloroflexi bacterium]|uniref:Sulfite oxidase and related enzymes n=1 Tax=uncultured Chloroflexota bacterium TaxID=166587 RepID=A0A6J4JT93_9CHLR|nr:MAG: Sulfite oxidase and related enzymes [uncultured Chloroflexota bacterium]
MVFRLPSRLKGSGANTEKIEQLRNKLDPDDRERVPPGQFVTDGWPVLHHGSVPRTNLAAWDFKVWGLVEQPLSFTWEQLQQLPRTELVTDIHCVTRWSKLDQTWEGVPMKHVLELVKPRPEARFVIAHAEAGFTANLPIEAILDDDVLLADKADGHELTPEHGWPLRLLVPRRYFWKSAKWLRGLEFSAVDQPGFWEQNGYNNNADPWREERYW